jgi:DNA-binding PadR family transcriptional regulator
MSEDLNQIEQINKNVLFLLCAIGICNYGTTWYHLEQKFIYLDFRIAKLSHSEAYRIIDKLNLVDYQDKESEDNIPKRMLINAKGKGYLENHRINIDEIRGRVFSVDDLNSELNFLEKFIYGA